MWLLIGYGALWAIASSCAVGIIGVWSISRNDAQQEEDPHSMLGIVSAGIGVGALVTALVAMVFLW